MSKVTVQPEWLKDVQLPGMATVQYLRQEAKPPKPPVPSYGNNAGTGGIHKLFGGQNKYGRSSPPQITPESLAGSVHSDWGRGY